MVLLQEKRKNKGLSQQQLAEISGIPQQTISAIESGARKNPGVETLAPLARAMGCKIDDLYMNDAAELGIQEADNARKRGGNAEETPVA